MEDISGFLEELAGSGTSIICASAEYEQLATLCTRVIIVSDGRLQAELQGSSLTKDRILAECLRGSPSEKSAGKGKSLDDSN